jgi:hypothetical protein
VSKPSARTSFELFVGRHLSPAMLATFPVALFPTAVPRKTVHRLRVGADSDIAEIVQRLTERDVQVLDIRRCPERPRREPRQVAGWNVPVVEEAGRGVVVPLPPAGPTAPGVAEPPDETDGGRVVPISSSRVSDAGARRARRPRRRAGRG